VISEALLSIAVRQKYNMVFETTGSNASVKWCSYMLRRMSESGYETQLFYPYVRLETLVQRCDERALASGRYIPHEIIRKFSQEAGENFAVIARHSDQVFVFAPLSIF